MVGWESPDPGVEPIPLGRGALWRPWGQGEEVRGGLSEPFSPLSRVLAPLGPCMVWVTQKLTLRQGFKRKRFI